MAMASGRREFPALSGAILASLVGCVAAPDGMPFSVAGGRSSDPEPDASDQRVAPDAVVGEVEAFLHGNTASAFDRLVDDEPALDHFVSPFSVSTALAMAWAGARDETEAAMAETLHFPFGQAGLHLAFNALDRELHGRSEVEVEDGDPLELDVANAIWPRDGLDLREAFLDELAVHYGARPVALDFANGPERARRTIDGWVAEVFHDTFVAVDEQGTEAAAATAVVTGDGGVRVEFEVAVDRPFLFLIHDRPTGAVLFVGRVVSVPEEP